MKHFPITIVDNFYDDPDFVRHYALSQKFKKSETGHWPGERTQCLSLLNLTIYNNFFRKIFSLFYDLYSTELDWKAEVTFQKINNLSEDPQSYKNKGWVHCDEQQISGLVYLNPSSLENCGTSIYRLNNSFSGVFDAEKEFVREEKFKLYTGQDVSEENYSKALKSVNDKFTETIRIENVYNRLILFNGRDFHGVPSFYLPNGETRLTQVFFIRSLKRINNDMFNGENYPISRMRMGIR